MIDFIKIVNNCWNRYCSHNHLGLCNNFLLICSFLNKCDLTIPNLVCFYESPKSFSTHQFMKFSRCNLRNEKQYSNKSKKDHKIFFKKLKRYRKEIFFQLLDRHCHVPEWMLFLKGDISNKEPNMQTGIAPLYCKMFMQSYHKYNENKAWNDECSRFYTWVWKRQEQRVRSRVREGLGQGPHLEKELDKKPWTICQTCNKKKWEKNDKTEQEENKARNRLINSKLSQLCHSSIWFIATTWQWIKHINNRWKSIHLRFVWCIAPMARLGSHFSRWSSSSEPYRGKIYMRKKLIEVLKRRIPAKN